MACCIIAKIIQINKILIMTHAFKSLLYGNGHFHTAELEKLFLWCVNNKVNDLTLQNEEAIICEIDSKKHHVTSNRLTLSDMNNIISHLHSPGAVSEINSGREIDFAWSLKKDKYTTYRFRINAKSAQVLSDKGYCLSIRVIPNKAPELHTLNLPQGMLDAFCVKDGMIYVTGPTGSGKTTLLASVIQARLQNPDSHLKISTFESPIEMVYDDIIKPTSVITQNEIGVHMGSFALGGRNSLRTRSDVVLIGEARDYDTIDAVLNVAMTGPLVYTTCHTNNVSEVPARLINVFPENIKQARLVDMIDNMRMIVTQKLIEAKTGGRIAIQEYLIFNQDIKDRLIDSDLNRITYTMRNIMKTEGHSFLEDLTQKLDAGLITSHVFEKIKKDLK
jgi:defect in organelle trafficking protein DotB